MKLTQTEETVIAVLEGQEPGYLASPACSAFHAADIDHQTAEATLGKLADKKLVELVETHETTVWEVRATNDEWDAFHEQLEAWQAGVLELGPGDEPGDPPVAPPSRELTETVVADRGWQLTDKGRDVAATRGLTVE